MSQKILIATYSYSGTTQRAADALAKAIHADQYQIAVPEGTFSSNMFETDKIAKQQIADNHYPQLTNQLPDLTAYDLIIVGSPVWSSRPASPVHTFLQQIQGFSGKVASFYTDAGTPSGYTDTFKQWAGDLKVVDFHEGSNGLADWAQQL